MKLLALDTSTDACSVALWLDGECQQLFELTPRGHTLMILPMVEKILATAGIATNQLDALAFGRGPGSFTGVRVATGVIQGLSYGLNCPVFAISSLAAVAQQLYQEHAAEQALIAVDARMNEVFWGVFELNRQQSMQLYGRESVSSPDDVTIPHAGNWLAAGSGWQAYNEQLSKLQHEVSLINETVYPQARYIADLACKQALYSEGVCAEQALPVYLRDKVVQNQT